MLLTLDSTVSNVSVANISRRMIDLNGPEGNAFYLLGLVSANAKNLGLHKSVIQQRMMAGDYFDLVAHFEAAFGNIYYLVLPESMDALALEQRVDTLRKEYKYV